MSVPLHMLAPAAGPTTFELVALVATSLVLGLAMLVFILYIQYPNRAIFTRARKDIPLEKGGRPIVGHLYQGLEHRSRRLERGLELIKEYGLTRRVTVWPIFRKRWAELLRSNGPSPDPTLDQRGRHFDREPARRLACDE